MILLKPKSLTPERKVRLEAQSLQMKERDGSENITVTDMTGIDFGSMLQDEGDPGDGIVYRVKSIGDTYENGQTTVGLEHAVNILKDDILFGDFKAPQITGNPKAKDCTAEEAVRFILRRCPDWELGQFDFRSVRNPYKFDGETLFEGLEKVSDSLEGAIWSYNFTVYPFRLNITRQSAEEKSELRASRNLKTIRKNGDKSGMFTRFYPIGKNDLHLPEEYVERNAGRYGVKSKTETDQTLDTVEELRRWANERLRKHAEPTWNIEADGMELAKDTGVTTDRLTLGTVCRIPLPKNGIIMRERIVALNYSDKLRNPKAVKVTMANTPQDVTKIIADIIRKGGGGGRAGAKKDKEDFAWFEDTNNHVAMCAKGIVGVDAEGNPNWTRMSQIIVNENGIDSTVKGVKKDVEVANTRISQNEYAITLEANRAQDAERAINSKVTVANDKISLVVTEKNGRAVVNSASIVAGINGQSGSYVKIRAQTIDLAGYVTASQLSAVNAKIDNLYSGNAVATQLRANSLRIISGYSFYYGGDVIHKRTVTIGEDDYRLLTW